MKIKLVLIDQSGEKATPEPLKYFVNTSRVRHIDRWRYSPDGCERLVESVFERGH